MGSAMPWRPCRVCLCIVCSLLPESLEGRCRPPGLHLGHLSRSSHQEGAFQGLLRNPRRSCTLKLPQPLRKARGGSRPHLLPQGEGLRAPGGLPPDRDPSPAWDPSAARGRVGDSPPNEEDVSTESALRPHPCGAVLCPLSLKFPSLSSRWH